MTLSWDTTAWEDFQYWLSAAHVTEVNRYNHDLKTGKVKASRNAGGLLLVRLGLVAAKVPKV